MRRKADSEFILSEHQKGLIAAKRRRIGLSIKAAAKAIGVSSEIYRRAMNGDMMLKASFTKLSAWAEDAGEATH